SPLRFAALFTKRHYITSGALSRVNGGFFVHIAALFCLVFRVTYTKEGFANEPPPEEGSFEWFRRELVSHGVVKEGEDLSNDQLAFALEILPTLLKAFKKKMK
ncbi:MAG: hypothetical protein LBK41_05725, partial [Clostridiales bacterium]|nr:hypothetical protein [Clostridiales bacterium]